MIKQLKITIPRHANTEPACHIGSMGNRIKYLRQKKGLTQPALAELIDSTPPTVARLESGDRRLTDKWVFKLSEALECHPGELFEEMPETIGDMDEDLMTKVFLKTMGTSAQANHEIDPKILGGFLVRFYLLCLGKSEVEQDALLEAMSSEAMHASKTQITPTR